MGKSEITYAELQHRALLDLAARIWADPSAPRAHVEAARAALKDRSTNAEALARGICERLTPDEISAIRGLVDRVCSRLNPVPTGAISNERDAQPG